MGVVCLNGLLLLCMINFNASSVCGVVKFWTQLFRSDRVSLYVPCASNYERICWHTSLTVLSFIAFVQRSFSAIKYQSKQNFYDITNPHILSHSKCNQFSFELNAAQWQSMSTFNRLLLINGKAIKRVTLHSNSRSIFNGIIKLTTHREKISVGKNVRMKKSPHKIWMQ